ncbi:hypothetical protein WICMUC_003310 [Wickerhamomyces mucosus]|uniref:Protein YIP n=1 Tax=Wickerhamomyces mucosus TaxID=1378264 RepID=A0A9P8PN23_9ASCO|nr:hypothetical protein WICMUC_003310 [Wickerhamomyces mucosus]
MSGWKPVSVDPNEADDFDLGQDLIEPDVEPPQSTSAKAKTSQPTQQNPQLASSSDHNNNSFFNFTSFTAPKIDLSNTLNPILQKEQVKELRFSGGDTLDEPVWKTLQRDIHSIGIKLFSVIWPASLSKLAKVQQHNLLIYARNTGVNLGINYDEVTNNLENDISSTIDDSDLKKLDWDLWGPLVFILLFSVIVGVLSPTTSNSVVFSGVFTLIWVTFAIIAINIQLLGGTISFFSALSTTGYALFPLLISATVSIFVKLFLVRFLLFVVFVSWSIYAATLNLKVNGVLPGRIFLAIYPVGLVYATLGWLCVIT